MLDKLLGSGNWAGVAVGALIAIITLKEILPIVFKLIEIRKEKKNEVPSVVIGSAGQRSRTNASYDVDHRDILEALKSCLREQETFQTRTLEMLNAILGFTRDLYGWHNTRDSDGVFRWMNKSRFVEKLDAMERALDRIGCPVDDVKEMTRLIKEIHARTIKND